MKKENKLFCTIFTPTYNRGDLLKKIYKSLINQQDKDFEWLIVDDGSVDDTTKIINNFIEENIIKIRYIKQKNGGKHQAINKGIEYANGEVFAIVDSDDYLLKNAIEMIKKGFLAIKNPEDKKFCGVAFQRGYSENKIIGKFPDVDYLDAKNTERLEKGIEGDKFEIYYTNVLKKYRFPVFKDEKFMTEAIVWNRIARDGYYLRWYKDIIYICNYLEGGLTDNRDKIIRKSPKGYALFIREQVEYGNISLKQKMGYYSYYAKVLKGEYSISEIKKELNTNYFMLYLSMIIRKILRR